MVKTFSFTPCWLFFLLFFQSFLQAQENTNKHSGKTQMPVNCTLFANAGPDESICAPGGNVPLQGSASGNYCHFYWSPPMGLSSTGSLNPIATVNQTTTYTLSAVGPNPSGTNLIYNGDFEQGDVGFTSNYYWDPSGVLDEEAYFITTRGDLAKWDWQPCTDHTSSSGNMMCVNASTLGGVDVWCQTVNVQPYTDYIFSLWLVTLHPSSPAQLQFSINNQIIGAPFSASPLTCLWEENCTSWNSGSNTIAEICILNLNTESWGNDFAIDDISFREACVYRDEVTIYVQDRPMVQNITEQCTPVNTDYQVSFKVTNGAAPYQLTGGSGSWNGNIFTSDPIPEGQFYSFQLSDANGCGITDISGIHDCDCLTDAGSFPAIMEDLCEDEWAILAHNNDHILDANDILQFILHDNVNSFPGTIYAVSATPSFEMLPGMMAGQTYYVTALAGDSDFQGDVLWTHTCFDHSNSVPVRFNPLPNGYLSLSTSDICLGETAELQFHLEGNGPFQIGYMEGGQLLELENVEDGYHISVSSSWNMNYTLLFINEGGPAGCNSNPNASVNLIVHPNFVHQDQISICDGEQYFLAGEWQSEEGTYLDTLESRYGCDSLIRSHLTIHSADTIYQQLFSCNPLDTGLQMLSLNNQYGCDSLVISATVLLDRHEVFLDAQSCDPTAAGLQSLVFTNQFGCDSIVTTNTQLLPSDTTYLSAYHCDPSEVGEDIVIAINQYGCDSLIITSTYLLPSHEAFIDLSSCAPADTGLVIQYYINEHGCDSIEYIHTALLPSDWIFLTATSCDPTAAGQSTDYLTNQYGCDSIVTTQTNLLPSSQTNQAFNTCEETEVGIDSVWLTNSYGCDSLLVQTTSLLSIHHCEIAANLEGDTIHCDELSGSLALTATTGLIPFSYQWEGETTQTFGEGIIHTRHEPIYVHGLAVDNYSVTIHSANELYTQMQTRIGADERLQIEVQAQPLYNDQTISCAGAADGMAEALIQSGGLAPYQYDWQNGQTDSIAVNLSDGWHFITVTDGKNCIAIDSVYLEAPAPLGMTLDVSEITCFGYSDGAVLVEAPVGGTPPYEYILNGSDFQEEGQYEDLAQGDYLLQISDINACSYEEWLTIYMPPPLLVSLGPDITLELGDSLIIQPVMNKPFSAIDQFLWKGYDCEACPALRLRPLQSTAFSINIIDDKGCMASDDIQVKIDADRDVFIPNAFSPNGDGLNDQLIVFGGQEVEEVRTFQVFDRWGGKQFEASHFPANEPAFGWDGTHAGAALNPAVFLYFAEIVFIDGKVIRYQGDVTLLR